MVFRPRLEGGLAQASSWFFSCRFDAEKTQVYDAILRTCNQQWTPKLDCYRNLQSLLELAELPYDSYLVSPPATIPVPGTSPGRKNPSNGQAFDQNISYLKQQYGGTITAAVGIV